MPLGEVIAAAAYSAGRKVQDIAIEESGAWAAKPGHFVWIGLHEPDEPPAPAACQAQFGLHELAIEDARHAPPAAEARAVRRDHPSSCCAPPSSSTATSRSARPRCSSAAATSSRCATAPRRPTPGCGSAPRARRSGSPTARTTCSTRLIDFIVDNYLVAGRPAARERSRRSRRRCSPRRSTRPRSTRLYVLRRELQRLQAGGGADGRGLPAARARRAAGDRPDLPALLPGHRRPPEPGGGADRHPARDAELRLRGEPAHRVGAAGGRSAAGLTGWAAILAVPTAIAGIYGMNFEIMPELHWAYGYPAALGVIAVTCGYLYHRFRRSGWIQGDASTATRAPTAGVARKRRPRGAVGCGPAPVFHGRPSIPGRVLLRHRPASRRAAGRRPRSSGSCCRAAAPGAAAVGLVGRIPPSPSGARSTTGPRTSNERRGPRALGGRPADLQADPARPGPRGALRPARREAPSPHRRSRAWPSPT